MRKYFFLFPFFAVLLPASLAAAQQCTTQVMVNAFDSATRTDLHGLLAGDFEARLGRSSLQVVSAHPVFRNRVLVLLDLGRSSDRNSDLQGVAALLREAPLGLPVAFGVFAGNAVFTPGFLTDDIELSAAIENVLSRTRSLKPGSAIIPALHQALRLFGPHQPGDTVLLISSGAGFTGKKRERALTAEFLRRGVRLQLLIGMPSSDRNDITSVFLGRGLGDNLNDDLIRFANRTGGALMGLMNSDWFNISSAGYLLTIRMPENLDRPKNWKLSVRNPEWRADLFYPAQLPPCNGPMLASAGAKRKPRP